MKRDTSETAPPPPPPPPPPPSSVVARLALLNQHRWSRTTSKDRPLVLEYLAVVKEVAGDEQAMTCRVARYLAYAKTQDVGEVGYPSWTAFVKEFSPWRASRTREYVRLVESRPYGPAGKPAGFRPRFALDLVKDAMSKRVIDLTVATRAPREIGVDASPEAQLAWLAEATFATLPSEASRHPAFMHVMSGDEMRRILSARELAAVLIGWAAPVAVVDEFIFDCMNQKLTGEQIMDRARAVPPKPERLGKAVPDWKDDPSSPLLGPWVEPTDIHDAIAQLRALELVMDKRRVLLGIAYDHIKLCALWTEVPGCESLAQLCIEHLEIGQRSFQRYAKEGRGHDWYPEAKKAIEEGRISADRAAVAMENAGNGDARAWLELTGRLCRMELQRARERTSDLDTLRDYAPTLDMARRVEAIVRGEAPATEDNAPASAQATAFGATAERIAAYLQAAGPIGQIQVALRDDANRRSPKREPDHILVPPGLLAAADYLLAHATPPAERGSRKTVARDGYECKNPRCRRRTIRVHHHHMVQRQHGGTDDPANTITGCPACHLRAIHSGRMSVVRIDDWIVWRWKDGSVTIMGSSLGDLVDAGWDGRPWNCWRTPGRRAAGEAA